MPIELECSCGEILRVLELYAGGHVVCSKCSASVAVPADAVSVDEKFRFHCPHCEQRVVARVASAGKKSKCPSCGETYVVPEPPREADTGKPEEPRRIQIDSREFAPNFLFPYKVGKLEPMVAQPPKPRYMHSLDDPEETRQPAAEVQPAPAPPLLAPPPVAPMRREPEPIVVGGSDVGPIKPECDVVPFEPPHLPMGAKRPSSVGELQVIAGGMEDRRIRLDFQRLVVGAERDCHVQIATAHLSRHHCVFKKDAYALRVRDLGSRDGTLVNGRPIAGEVVLNPGDEVRMGDVTMHVVLPHAPQVMRMKDSRPSISDFVIL